MKTVDYISAVFTKSCLFSILLFTILSLFSVASHATPVVYIGLIDFCPEKSGWILHDEARESTSKKLKMNAIEHIRPIVHEPKVPLGIKQ